MAKPNYAAMAEQLNLTPKSVRDAIDDLNDWVCLHPNFVTALQVALNAISGRSRDLLIVVIGPARVGKTTLFESIAGILDELARKDGKRRGCFRFSVPPPDARGRFNWTAAIGEAYALSEEILQFSKVKYGDITEGAPKRSHATVSGAAAEEALWLSFLKNIRLEQLVTIVDEGNTIPVTLSELQVTRAIHALKYIVAQTGQPLVIGGTSAIKHIVEHDVQLEVRTKILMLDAYGNKINEKKGFYLFVKEMEERLGPELCVPCSLSAHAEEVREGTDGRPGLVVRLATDALSQHGDRCKLTWALYKIHLDRLAASSGEDLAAERNATKRPIVAAAEAATTKKAPGSKAVERSGRVGATRNTNAPNHPFA
jgi:hypothetical protein